MQDTVQTPQSEQAPAVVEELRTITYPLRGGGSLTATCPAWCTYDHTNDVASGILPNSLFHQGDKIGLEYSANGVELGVLEARIEVWPFDEDGDNKPYIELVPEGRTGVGLICNNRIELDDEIRKVRAHLNALVELGDRLAEAQAVDHQRHVRPGRDAWASLSHTDVQSMPIAYLLRVFGVNVVETEDTGREAVAVLYGEPGAMELRIKPDMSQYMREDQARCALLGWFEARQGGDV